MALAHSPSIVTTNLGSCLDAANPRSYPGSGTSWRDVSGTGNNGTLVNGVTYSGSNLGLMSFDGVDDYASLGTFFNYQTFSISLWVNAGTTQVQYADILDNNHTGTLNFAMQQDNFNTNNYNFFVQDASGTISSVNFILTANVWTNLTFTFTPTNRMIGYINGQFASQGSLANNRNIAYVNPTLNLGSWVSGGRNWNGKMSLFMAYNRVLTDQEVLQNFNALRGRYGI